MLSNREVIELKSHLDHDAFEVRHMARAIAALFILAVVASIAFVSHPESFPVAASVSEPLQVEPGAAAASADVPPDLSPAAAAADATPREKGPADRPDAEELQYVTYGG